MFGRGWRRTPRSSINYYLAWQLLEDEHEEEIRRDIEHRRIQRVYFSPNNINDAEFIKNFRLDKPAFNHLCDLLQSRGGLKGSQRVSVEQKVLCALQFFASGSYQRIVGRSQYFGQTTVSLYVRQVTDALCCPGVLNNLVKMPETMAERNCIRQKFLAEYGIPGVIGCIDGCHFHIVTPAINEHLYFCRKNFHSLNVQIICDCDCRIININARYGGATHDAFIWENSLVNPYMQSLHRQGEVTYLLGDSGYPQRPWLMTPITDAAEGSPEAKYTAVHGRARVLIENTFGRLKNRWRCLSKDRVLHYTPERCAKIITACCVLHNLAINFNVQEPEYTETHTEVTFNRQEVPNDGPRSELLLGRALRRQVVQRVNLLH